jgi:hypothetical protein
VVDDEDVDRSERLLDLPSQPRWSFGILQIGTEGLSDGAAGGELCGERLGSVGVGTITDRHAGPPAVRPRQIAAPIPPPAPVTSATRRANSGWSDIATRIPSGFLRETREPALSR